MIETKKYSDGTTATGVSPVPDLSPKQQDAQLAYTLLDDIESIMGGRNGPSIQLRGLIEQQSNLANEQLQTIIALNDCIGGEGSLTTDNLVRVSRLEHQINEWRNQAHQSQSNFERAEATIAQQTEELRTLRIVNDNANEMMSTANLRADELAYQNKQQAEEIARLKATWTPVCNALTGTDILEIESPVDYVMELFAASKQQAERIKELIKIDQERATQLFDEMAKTIALERQLAAANASLASKDALLKHLVDECLASDFNEYWDSYKNALAAIERHQIGKVE